MANIHIPQQLSRCHVRWASTIYALSSAHGKCGVSVIRISGPKSNAALNKLTLKEKHAPRRASLNPLIDPVSGHVLDHALTLWFPGPKSFTGEDSAELMIHGGNAVVRAVLNALSAVEGLRPAKAGEYVRRAYANNKLDLTQVEGLSDLINAETEQQRLQAVRHMEGSLQRQYQRWSEFLLQTLAKIEAFVDFADHGDVEDDAVANVTSDVQQLLLEVQSCLKDARSGELLRNGVKAVIVGDPNVGKSSLLNFLVQRPAAIVSPMAGTTRDVIETCIDLGGYPMVISDTAGQRESAQDPVEIAGMEKARATTASADLVIAMTDARTALDQKFGAESLIDRCGGSEVKHRMLVVNKSDLLSEEERSRLNGQLQKTSLPWAVVSCKTEGGTGHLLTTLATQLQTACETQSSIAPSRERHRHHLATTVRYLNKFIASEGDEWVIRAHYLQMAYKELGLITGRGSMADVHDAIFSDFCIGK